MKLNSLHPRITMASRTEGFQGGGGAAADKLTEVSLSADFSQLFAEHRDMGQPSISHLNLCFKCTPLICLLRVPLVAKLLPQMLQTRLLQGVEGAMRLGGHGLYWLWFVL